MVSRRRLRWQFGTKAGTDEILRRRIGRNELSAIQVSLAYVEAQNEYASLDPAGLGRGVYAKRMVSRPGKRDGLYWPSAEGETPSPLGALAAQGPQRKGTRLVENRSPITATTIVFSRGRAGAPLGPYDYVVNGKMRDGFALLTYPAAYGNSGIMTFMVNHDGTVFQKDLGRETERFARRNESFLPDSTWSQVNTTP